jgi:hypothetical protein
MEPIIYVDDCPKELEDRIYQELGLRLVKRLPDSTWCVNDAMAIITDPNVVLAVVNQINDVALMEIALLNFMCKPILVTHKAIENYPLVERCIEFIDYPSYMKDQYSKFIDWFKWWEAQ